jgi:TPP-dependent pyruvate/acetoin dehydrogenase alpha subunit
MLTRKELIDFSNTVSDLFEAKKIHGPIHLCGGNETELIRIFSWINKKDWVFSTHRNMYHALLKGIPREELIEKIISGECMHVYSLEHRFFTSAIVAGCSAIAVGTALAIKKRGNHEMVYCFLGDGATDCGRTYEAIRYAIEWDLPVRFAIEDNNRSCDTEVWERWKNYDSAQRFAESFNSNKVHYYQYSRHVPHTGTGKWVSF